MNRRLLFYFFAFDWLLLNLLPFALTPAYNQLLWWRHLQQLPLMLNLLFLSLAAWICFEFVLLSTVFGFLKAKIQGPKNRLLKLFFGLCSCTLIVAVATYILAIAASWILFQKRGIFLTPRTLNLGWFIQDAAVARLFTNADLLLVAQAILFSLLVAVTFMFLAPVQFDKRRNVTLATLLLTIALIAGSTPYYLSDQKTLFRLRSTAKNFISPRFSFFGARILLRDSSAPNEKVQLSLAPIYSLETYRANAGEPVRKPNFVVVVVEGMRADVIGRSHQGKAVTPTFDRLVETGHYFKQAYAQSPETDYSMTSILTGLYPLRKPYRELNFEINYPVTRIYDILKLYGYRSSLFASLWTSSHRLLDSESLDLNVDPRTLPIKTLRAGIAAGKGKKIAKYSAAVGDRYSVDQLKRWLQENNESKEPFAAFIYLFSPHFSYPLPEEQQELFSPTKLDKAPSFLGYPESLVPVMKNRYYNALRFADSLVAELQTFVAARDPNEQTVFFVTGDHGQMFNEHGQVAHSGPLYNEAIHVPLIISALPQFTAVGTYDSPVGLLDIPPTILSIMGLPPHGNFQGEAILRDIAKPLEQTSLEPRAIFSTVQVFSFEDAIIKWPWKYTINHVGQSDRLFNMQSDYQEQQNLLDEKADLAAELKTELMNFRNSQLYYYGDESSEKTHSFPPRYESPTKK